MARYCSLFSGSTGNCYYVGASGRGIIIDAGVSLRTAVSAMVSKKINLSTIDGILITHEHTDHIKGLTPLIKHLKV
ncbi:MAG: MBL fold metallo-hydrolase, partial [Oscillospiraceae bacterium]